jgi:alpha-glucoside transport system permease protein
MSVAPIAAQPIATQPTALQRRRPLFRWRPSRSVLNIILALVALFWLVPTIGLTIISLRPLQFFLQSGWWTVFTAPAQLTLQNYANVLNNGLATGGVLDSAITSLAITIPVTILVVVISGMAAYSLVFGRWRGRDAVFLGIVALLVVPVQVALIPVVQIFAAVHNLIGLQVYGTILGVVLFHVAFGLPFGIFLMRNFYTGIPNDLVEAGRIDGAGEWTLFQRVVLPISLPAALSLAIFQFIWVWNDLLVALVFLGGSAHQPLTVFMYDHTRALAESFDVVATGAMISIVIPLIVFFAFQRYFVQGVLAGSVK